MSGKLSIKDLDVNGKKVLMRVDFNVPLDKQLNITDDTRIVAALPSIQYILDHGGSVILMSHLGRPKNGPDPAFSLKPCQKRLSELLNRNVQLAPDCIGSEVEQLAQKLQPGDVLILENLRFHPAEEKPEKDPSFAKKLATLGDVYVNDAFGSAHRAHSSTATIAQYFPDRAAAGFLLEREINFIGKALLNPVKPFHAIIGGAKIGTKLGVLKALTKSADAILIGGGMAFTLLKAKGIAIGKSICEDDSLDKATAFMQECNDKGVQLLLPVDFLIADSLEANAKTQIIETANGIPDGWYGVDIGPKTIEEYASFLQNAKTVLWNGPLGIFEVSPFAKGTLAIAKTLANLKATTIIGGGDSIAAINQAGLADKMSHISTGGGATLEYIEFGTLPGIDALSNAKKGSHP